MLTASQLLAIYAVLEVRLGRDHPLTRAVKRAHDHRTKENPHA